MAAVWNGCATGESIDSSGDGSGGFVSSTGGGVGSGGIVGTGGIVATGGFVGSGGIVGTGGIVGSGGLPGTGGVMGTGGITGTGGVVGTGGAATGGAPGTGGAVATGGSPGTGGTPSCVPAACPGGADCGVIDDGCGDLASCGAACAAAQACIGNVCEAPVFDYTPSNFDPAGLDASDADDTTTLNCGESVFNSETLAFTNWCGAATPTPVVRPQAGGADLVILPINHLAIASGATLRLEGNRPVVIAVFGDATIDGTVDASASGATAGPGGNLMCDGSTGLDGAGPPGDGSGGGGGGGHATAGGDGGNGDEGGGGDGGVGRGADTIVPLLGGCGGGHGGGCASAPTGAGGGAVQVSVVGQLTVNGSVRSNGGDGANGDGCGDEAGGSGGGSGGSILLEGDVVVVGANAQLVANGGRGGDGASGGDGGNGGTATSAPQNGDDHGLDGGGAGGGAAGRVRTNGATALITQ